MAFKELVKGLRGVLKAGDDQPRDDHGRWTSGGSSGYPTDSHGFYAPNPAHGEAARVGVPGDSVPPPPKDLPRLPNLTPDERAIEERFASRYEKDPDGMANEFRTMLGNGLGSGPTIFSTDDAKMLDPSWKGPGGKDLSQDTKNFRALYNTSLHQTANAVAKRAFIQHLDDVVSKLPEDQRRVLVTAGGVASGKDFAIGKVEEAKEIRKIAAATWNTAGEQNSTELGWVAKECASRGIKMTAVYVHADPEGTWDGPKGSVLTRAEKSGRMVDARLFADSYVHGAKNFADFQDKHSKDPNVDTIVIHSKRDAPTERLDRLPDAALKLDADKLYGSLLERLDKSGASAAVKAGGSAGKRIWRKKD